jgi:hypothetical protein
MYMWAAADKSSSACYTPTAILEEGGQNYCFKTGMMLCTVCVAMTYDEFIIAVTAAACMY